MMRVSLAQARSQFDFPRGRRAGAADAADALLATAGARVVLGGNADGGELTRPIAPSATTLFGPRGVCLAGPNGPLIVCDTGHHRLLVWRTIPREDQTPADFVVGQADFVSEGRNGKRDAGPATLNVPTGVCLAEGVLAVADAWNHRVLLWRGAPERSNRPADVVLGQPDFQSCLPNRGAQTPDRRTLNWCYGVAIAGGRLIVADSGNRRVLVWNEIPRVDGAPADLVLGQRDFASRDENAGNGGGPRGMRWPHAAAVVEGGLLVADAGNNRVMAWRRFPDANGEPCDFAVGQPDTIRADHNRGAWHPAADALNMPHALGLVGGLLVVADTANSRVVGYDLASIDDGRARATRLAGQRTFEDKGDNRWGPATRDSLCWPYGVAACDGLVAIADSGNNRVLLWEAAP